MTRTCGRCEHSEPEGEHVVACYGAPPTVIGVTNHADGTCEVRSRNPLLAVDNRACALFALKKASRRK